MPKTRGDVRKFGHGMYRARLLDKVHTFRDVVLHHKNASNACQSDVKIEKYVLKTKQQPVKLTTEGRKVKFRCVSLSAGMIYFHQFVYFLKLELPLTAAPYEKWREQCIAKSKDVDHIDGKVWRIIREELQLISASSNRAKNGRS